VRRGIAQGARGVRARARPPVSLPRLDVAWRVVLPTAALTAVRAPPPAPRARG
jgi:hypothetical protein